MVFSMCFAASFAQPCDRRAVYLSTEFGAGLGLYRDMGSSPLTYRGQELSPRIGVRVERPEWRIQADMGVCGGGYGYRYVKRMHTYGGQASVAFRVLYSVLTGGTWRLWAGGAVEDRADIRYNRALGNASVGISNFVDMNLVGRLEKGVGRWRLHGQVELSPLSLLLRPGFSYMDNYDRDIGNPVANTFDQYHWYIAGGTLAATDIGATLLLGSGNRIGVAYRWHYLTSRTAVSESAPYRFEQAGHAFVVSLDFRL